MEERRKAPRVQEKAEVRIKLADSEDELACKIIRHLTQDISLTGVKVQCNMFIPVNSLLKIELSLRKPVKVIPVTGRVRWIKTIFRDELYEMGVEFVDTSQEAIRILESCLSELTK
jgi:c-di-GMP-binding flagellar brake protein YcgR